MDLSNIDIKPAEGMIALRFVDDIDEPASSRAGPSPTPECVPYEGLLAIVVGVGAKVTGIKKGQTVITRPYARDGLSIGENTVLTDAYCVVGTLTE